jgi:hypothetical protein
MWLGVATEFFKLQPAPLDLHNDLCWQVATREKMVMSYLHDDLCWPGAASVLQLT